VNYKDENGDIFGYAFFVWVIIEYNHFTGKSRMAIIDNNKGRQKNGLVMYGKN